MRTQFDLPLIQDIAGRTGDGRIDYFGLPGEEALDLKCWGSLCRYVAAVERSRSNLRRLRQRLDDEFGEVWSRTYYGDVDRVILDNGSVSNGRWQRVATAYRKCMETEVYTWDFDVVYLDYFASSFPTTKEGLRYRTGPRH